MAIPNSIKISSKTYGLKVVSIPVGAKERGNNEVWMKCPFCGPSRKPQHKNLEPFSFNTSKNVWRCKHCNESGAILTDDEYQSQVIKPLGKAPRAKNRLSISSDMQIKDWFVNTRHISIKTVDKLGLRVCNVSMKIKYGYKPEDIGEFKEVKAIAYPFFYQGKLVNIVYRDIYKNFSLETGADNILFNIDNISPESDYLVITEGMNDTAAYIEGDINEVVSVPNGVAVSDSEIAHFKKTGEMRTGTTNLTYITKCYNQIKNKEKYYLATDNDAAGIKLRNELARRLGEEKCYIVDFSYWQDKEGNPINDPNQLLIVHGREAMQQSLDRAIPFPNPEVYDVRNNKDVLDNHYTYGAQKGIPLGVPGLDGAFSVRKGHFVGLNGFGNNGKTSFSVWFMVVTALIPELNFIWGIYSPENYPIELFIDMLAEVYVGKSLDKRSGDRMTKKEYNDAVQGFISDHFYFIDREEGYSPSELRELKSSMIRQYGCNAFLTDPWNALTEDTHYGENDYKWLVKELSYEQRFANHKNVYNMVAVHPPTPKKRNADGSYDHPSLFEVDGGKIWNTKLYDMICVHRENQSDKSNTKLEVYIQKIKFQKLCGIPNYDSNPILLNYRRSCGRYLSDNGIDVIEALKRNAKKEKIKKAQDMQLTLASDEFENI